MAGKRQLNCNNHQLRREESEGNKTGLDIFIEWNFTKKEKNAQLKVFGPGQTKHSNKRSE